ncbi:hypothetical protein IHE45_02G098000 [Dioscorea alata]|uniref:Uncharacterized protein n=1 Tax=Dioscorea alata TaxID=55571 RepID=A0ACB7WSQ6_DIOAL|nr:hypothetical protein IHE45_02G098000 [Dioscorea alata]
MNHPHTILVENAVAIQLWVFSVSLRMDPPPTPDVPLLPPAPAPPPPPSDCLLSILWCLCCCGLWRSCCPPLFDDEFGRLPL